MKNKSFKKLLTYFLTIGMVILSFSSAFAIREQKHTSSCSTNKPCCTSGDSQINLTWSSVPGATYYNVYISQDGLIYNLISVPDTITTTTYNVTGLTNGKLYYFKTSAANTDEESTYSNVALRNTISEDRTSKPWCGWQLCNFSQKQEYLPYLILLLLEI